MLIVKEIDDKKQWEDFLLSRRVKNVSFFQSWNWGELQKNLGNSINRLGFFVKDELIGVCLAVEIKARRGHYLHIRHGPVLIDFFLYFDACIENLASFAKSKKCEFIRMSPLIEEESIDMQKFLEKGFRNAPIHNMDAENAWVLDLDKEEDQILLEMRKTTRYLVRKAQTLPITIKTGKSKKDFGEFMKLYIKTSKRHGFVPHKGIEEEFDIFSQDNMVELYLAEYEGHIIAGAMILFYANQAVYHHGSSDEQFRDIPGAYLLQWRAIQEAKKRGLAIYNFWGVVPENKPNHPWKGLTLFKMGFGGRRVNYIHAQDLPLQPMYWKTHVIESLTKIRKGY